MYELTPLFYYKFQFIAELIVAEAILFCYCKRKEKFVLRVILSVVASFLFALIMPIVAYNALYCVFLFLMLAGFTVLMLKFCFDEQLFTIVFLAVSAYAIQHIAHQLYELVINVTGINGDLPSDSYNDTESLSAYNPFSILIYFLSYLVVYDMGFFIISNRYIKNFKKLKVKQMSLMIIAVCIMFFAIVLSLIMTYSTYDNYVQVYAVIVYCYDIFSCILALFIQYDMALRERLEIDYSTVSHLYRQEQEHFKVMKENINMINIKCHDLKHQVRAIGKQSLVSQEAIHEIEEAINIYDSSIETGNEVMNIILTEKSLLCNQKSIKLSCMIDGAGMVFMSESDIYSLFGNLIDNAIEAVDNVEKDKRMIGLNVKSVGNLLSINVYNFYEHELKYNAKGIETSKADKNYHGFGIKSIKHICKKYHGDMSITTDDNVFNTNILIPTPIEKKKM